MSINKKGGITMKDMIGKAKKLDWSVEKTGDKEYEFQKYSPEGQNFYMYITGDTIEEIAEDIYGFYERYDISEETALWIDHTGHGINGAPYHIEDIVEDMKYCKNMVLELYEELVKEE